LQEFDQLGSLLKSLRIKGLEHLGEKFDAALPSFLQDPRSFGVGSRRMRRLSSVGCGGPSLNGRGW